MERDDILFLLVVILSPVLWGYILGEIIREWLEK